VGKKRFKILLVELSLTLHDQFDSLRIHIKASIGVQPARSSKQIFWSVLEMLVFLCWMFSAEVEYERASTWPLRAFKFPPLGQASFGTILPRLQANDKLDLSLAWAQYQHGAEELEGALPAVMYI
jgi:hypothetical protein